MKNILTLLAVTILMVACKQQAPREEEIPLTLEEQIAIKISDELAKNERNADIILDHQFGMTRKEVFQHKNKLEKGKRIYGIFKTKNTRIFVYDLNLRGEAGINKMPVYFDTFYHENRLFRMECKPKIPKGKDIQQVQDAIINLYEKKYGKPDFYVPTDTISNYQTAMWIQLNQQIEISRDEKEVMMSYTDLQKEEEILEDI